MAGNSIERNVTGSAGKLPRIIAQTLILVADQSDMIGSAGMPCDVRSHRPNRLSPSVIVMVPERGQH